MLLLTKPVARKKQAAGKDRSNMSLLNVGELIPNYTATQVLFIDLKFYIQLSPSQFIIILLFAADNNASHCGGLDPRHAACYVKRSAQTGSFAGGEVFLFFRSRWQ
jgi:hypothetical protein